MNENMSEKSMLTYQALLLFLQYLTPLSIISFAYIRMALNLWGNRAPGNAEGSRDATLMKNKKKVIKMLVIVVVLFAICWLPLQTYKVLQYTYPEINEYPYINIIWFCFDWLAMSNSCYNPFIYGIYNMISVGIKMLQGKFKREFQQRCPFKSRKWPNSPPGDSVDLDKIQSTRTSIRYDWRRPASTGYPGVGSFYRGVPARNSSKMSTSRNKFFSRSKSLSTHCTKNGTKLDDNQCTMPISPNKTTELYVFSSGRHKHPKDVETEELCL